MTKLLSYIRRHHIGLIALTLALAGTAYAAKQISSKQIKNKTIVAKDVKPKTLTGKQVKDGKLTGADIGDGSLTGGDVADDSLTGADIDEASLNVSRVVARLRDPADQTVPRTGTITNLNDLGSWTQRADELDQFAGRVTVDFPAGCNPPRTVNVVIIRPGANPMVSTTGVVAQGIVNSTTPGAQTGLASLGPVGFPTPGSDPDAMEPGAEVTRSLDVLGAASCAGGSTADPVVTDIAVDVLGHR